MPRLPDLPPSITPGARPGWWPRQSDLAEKTGPVVHALFRLSRKNRAMVGEQLRPLGLYPGQELFLLQMPESGCRSQLELVEAMGIDHSTVTKMLQRLERAGVVARSQSEDDRRVVLVTLTDHGREQRRAVEGVWSRMEELTTSSLTDRQRADLLRLLRRVEAGLDAVAE